MPIRWFEVCCIAIIVLTLNVLRKQHGLAVIAAYLSLALAAFVGEDTMIAAYRYYAYDPMWDARLHHVPVLVPLIWPLVVLSARDVAKALGATGWLKVASASAALVLVDASLVEVVAVRAGLWRWADGGYLGVPFIGIFGWAAFAWGAIAAMELVPTAVRYLLVVVFAPVVAHALVLASYWLLFRYLARTAIGDLGSWGVAAASVIGSLALLRRRLTGRALMPLDVALPRVLAAALFLSLLVFGIADRSSEAPPANSTLYWLHVVAVAVPYLLATRFGWRRAST